MMRAGVSSRGAQWVSMGPLGWMTVGVCILLPYYTVKYTLVAMWWAFVVGPVKLWQAVAERRQGTTPPPVAEQPKRNTSREQALGPWPGVSKQPTPPRDWSSHQ